MHIDRYLRQLRIALISKRRIIIKNKLIIELKRSLNKSISLKKINHSWWLFQQWIKLGNLKTKLINIKIIITDQ